VRRRRTGRLVEVVNASVSGWGTDDELKCLTSHGMQWRPDLVLVAMTLHNDVSDNLRERFHAVRNGALVEKPRRDETFLAYKVIQLKGFPAEGHGRPGGDRGHRPAARLQGVDGRGRRGLYLERDGHWNKAGHRLASGIVASELVRLGLVREGDRRALSTPNGTQRLGG